MLGIYYIEHIESCQWQLLGAKNPIDFAEK